MTEISKKTINNCINERIDSISSDSLEKISKALFLTVSYFFEENGNSLLQDLDLSYTNNREIKHLKEIIKFMMKLWMHLNTNNDYENVLFVDLSLFSTLNQSICRSIGIS